MNPKYIQLAFFNQTTSSDKEPQNTKEEDNKDQTENVSSDDFYMDEIPYTQKEKETVWRELTRGIFLGDIHKGISKQKLKSWFADIAIHHFGEYCPNITGTDLVEIANEFGLKVKE